MDTLPKLTPSTFETHEVLNQPPLLVNYNPYLLDTVLQEGVVREGASWAQERLAAFGALTGTAEMIEHGFLANEFVPELETHDRQGRRIDEVDFHPSYHALMAAGVTAEIHSLPWVESRAGAHVVRAISHYLLTQVEASVLCPLTMTFAVVPSLQLQPEVGSEWIPRVTSNVYDPGLRAPAQKKGCLMGMAMTEKQGGSDVRANTTKAVPEGARGPGQVYRLLGHKWFCSAPMNDAFLTLAYAEGGLSCFLVPRMLPDASRNGIRIQRLKNKLGNKANASSEIEYQHAWAQMIGEEGRGVPTIIEMVSHTRLDCVVGTSALMRQALVQALHHTHHRQAFGRKLAEQPLMQNVLADLALEWEAATALMLRLARGYDEMRVDASQSSFVRIATAIGKYWVCKRGPRLAYEALECHGGNGYVEESIMPRVYREMPLASIWEGSGNVMCLDVLRAMGKTPETVSVLLEELYRARGADRRFDAHLRALESSLAQRDDVEVRARRLVERMALALQAALLLQHAPSAVADAFCASRLDETQRGHEYGTLCKGLDLAAIIARAWPVHS